MSMKKLLPAALIAVLAMPAAWAAGSKDGLELTVKSFQEMETTDAKGKKETKTVPAVKIVPGTEIIYVISWNNHTKQPATAVVVTNPVPKEVTFKPGSTAAVGATDEVSVDGGKSWGALEKLTVAGSGGKSRAATPADVTHVHWKLNAAIPAGGTGSVSYHAIVK